MAFRTTQAEALAQAGETRRAQALFREAEALQRELQASLPLLYSLQGYRVCDLLLAQGRAAEVLARYQHLLAWRQDGDSLLDHGLEELIAGRAAHLEARSAAGGAPALGALTAAIAKLDAAVEGLREAGTLDHLPRGLLARAACHREAGNDSLARDDLVASFDLCERAGLKLFHIDCWPESARQRLWRDAPTAAALERAEAAIGKAVDLVEATCAKRPLPDIALLRTDLALAQGDQAAAEHPLAELIGLMREGDLWSFLPDLTRLNTRYALGMEQTLAALRAEQSAFDTEADAYFEAARQPGEGGEEEAPAPAPALPDEMVDAMLADPQVREILEKLVRDSGLTIPFNQIPREAHAKVLAQLVAAGHISIGEAPAAEEPADAPAPSPEEPERKEGVVQKLFGRFLRRNR